MEKLTVKNLGPIKDFTMETNRLTVLIGPQASGKSLLAQMLYFFKEFDAMLAARFPIDRSDPKWFNNLLTEMLMSLRGTSFKYYLYYGGLVRLVADREEYEMTLQDEGYVCGELRNRAEYLLTAWEEDRKQLSLYSINRQLFIPTERSLYTRLNQIPVALFSDKMPYILSRFSACLDDCGRAYDARIAFDDGLFGTDDSLAVLNSLEKEALHGNITFKRGPRSKGDWYFFYEKEGALPLQLPVSSVSSGQMETWPFFAIANVYGMSDQPSTFYFEEPETHLHPKAQGEVVKTIAYLISSGHRFVITTHSPFILYVINNLIQAHIAYDGAPPEGEFSINPDHVAAYCLGENPRSIVKPDTRLLELREIDSVFDKLNVDFERYMDMEFSREGK